LTAAGARARIDGSRSPPTPEHALRYLLPPTALAIALLSCALRASPESGPDTPPSPPRLAISPAQPPHDDAGTAGTVADLADADEEEDGEGDDRRLTDHATRSHRPAPHFAALDALAALTRISAGSGSSMWKTRLRC